MGLTGICSGGGTDRRSIGGQATDGLPDQHKDGALVITLTRLSGSMFALNSDLIERVDSTPDTVITLVDGTKYVVREDLRSVVDAIRVYRGAVIAESARMAGAEEVISTNPPARRLVAVPDPYDGDQAGDLS